MQIDWTINITELATFIAIVGGGFFFLGSVRGDVDELKAGAHEIEERLAELARAITQIARAEEKIVSLNSRFDDEKREGVEFRNWLRDELRRIWEAVSNN